MTRDALACGEIAVRNEDPIINPNETVVVQLADGRTMLNVRSESHAHRRLVTTSRDGASGLEQAGVSGAVAGAHLHGSIVRLSQQRTRTRIASSLRIRTICPRAAGEETPGKSRDRKNVSIKLSYDEGRTWPVNKPLEAAREQPIRCGGFAGRHHALLLRAKRRDAKNRYKFLTLARFNLSGLPTAKIPGRPFLSNRRTRWSRNGGMNFALPSRGF